MEKEITLRKVLNTDLESLQMIGKQTFIEAFASKNTEKNIKEYLKNGFSTKKLKAEIENPNSEFFFALRAKRIIGYLKINFGSSQTEIKDYKALEIERIYVLKEFYGKKVGQLLLEKAISISEKKEVKYLWLGVWEENPRAIRFYEKFGFVEFDQHVFKLGNEEQTDIMMKLILK